MSSVLAIHDELLRKHINYFSNEIIVNKGEDAQFTIKVIWNDVHKYLSLLGVAPPEQLFQSSVASVYIDARTLHERNLKLQKNDTITGKVNIYEDEETFVIENIYKDRHLPGQVCFLKRTDAIGDATYEDDQLDFTPRSNA